MKKYFLQILLLSSLAFVSCDGGNGNGESSNSNKSMSSDDYMDIIDKDKITNKSEMSTLTKALKFVISEFEEKRINKEEYAERIEKIGDIYIKSKKVISPEARYETALMCYKEALKYNENEDLKKKHQKILEMLQVVDH